MGEQMEESAPDRRPDLKQWLAAAVTVILVAAGYWLAIGASGPATCCDAVAYVNEAQSILDGSPQFLKVHNYGYGTFLAILDIIGLGHPTGLAIAQTTLLLSLIHISEPTRRNQSSRMPSSA